VGKLLESDGLTINDVDIKVIPFTQYAVAFNNKAIDAAITIPPFTAQLLDGGHAVNFKDPDDVVKPHPLTIAVSMINTDFANANRELVRNYYVAYLRAIRDYCQAYHGGAERAALIDLAIRTGTETRPQLLHKYPWPARGQSASGWRGRPQGVRLAWSHSPPSRCASPRAKSSASSAPRLAGNRRGCASWRGSPPRPATGSRSRQRAGGSRTRWCYRRAA